jgi:hypothetical protein
VGSAIAACVERRRAAGLPDKAGSGDMGEHRGTFGDVRELTTAIKKFITGWNDRARPFVWTKTADEILKNANRQPTSNADH